MRETVNCDKNWRLDMQSKTAITHEVDGLYIPISAKHDRPAGELYSALLVIGCFLTLIDMAASSEFWAYTILPIVVAIAGYVWRYLCHDAWRQKAVSTEDIGDVRSFLALVNRHEIQLSKLPSPADKLSNGDLADWADKVNQELGAHYRNLLSQEVDALSCKVSLENK